ncbi:MAG: hypothetical protein M0P61_17830 [Ignavibacteriaceae bacterium]|nr:hypothetical protein [Ignavibacteriaceae bacterium]
MKSIILMVMGILIISLVGCSSLKLAPANFAWSIETVLPVDQNGMVTEKRYEFSFNAKPLFFAEKGDSALYYDEELHIIKNEKGFYFITAKSFSGVYVFQESDGALALTNKISFEQKLSNPAFNSRFPWIELVDGDSKYLLDNKGLKGN